MNKLKVPSLQSLVESDRGSNDSLLAESLQLDIEDLDDEEYAIPTIDTLPTLENVLNDMDADGDSENASELGAFGNSHPAMAARMNGGGGSALGTADGSDTASSALDIEPARMGTILRDVQLQGISAQIASAADRVHAGLATSLTVARQMTAVGTSHGHILAFDHQQALRWCWSPEANASASATASTKHHLQQGACAALAFNADATRLLAGFSRGLVTMIDTKSGDTLRSMPDLITPNTGVLHLRWTEHAATALCSDSGGSVWTLAFTRRLGLRGAQSRCIFSGARGEVCTIEPLCFAAGANAADHPLRSFCIAAMATLTKFVVVTVRPRLRVIKYRPLAGPPHTLPLLAWHMVLIQTAGVRRSVDPVLCAAHGRSVHFHQLCLRDGRLHLLFLRHIALAYDLLALHWLGPKTVAALDVTERLHLHDIRADRELEHIDMAAAGLVYASAQFKAHATGGNVSPALALAGTLACYQSVVAGPDNRIYLLGGRTLHSVSVRAWSERVAHLVRYGRWVDACALAVDGWRSAVEGAQQRPERWEHACETVRWLCAEWLATAQEPADVGLEAVIECAVETQQHDLLWSELWDRQRAAGEQPERYLRALTGHIRRGAVADVAPVVAQALCAFWQHVDAERLEQLVLQLDWRCLDLHLVLTAVRRERLWQAQIYLNATALGDYCASIVDLVPLVLVEDRRLGNHLLVYVSSCLAGRGYPRGEIAAERQAQVKHEVLRCLTAVHSNGAAADEPPYPYLRQLLRFDARDTLNVLALAFEEREFAGDLGRSHRQRIIHILLEIMGAGGGDAADASAAWPELGALLGFIARQLAQRQLPEHGHRELAERVMRHVRAAPRADESPAALAEREAAWLELLHADALPHLTMGDQLRAARTAGCLRVVQLLLERRSAYEDILPCFLDAPAGRRWPEMWAYVRRYALSEQRQVFAQVAAHVERLLAVDAAELVRVVRECWVQRVPELLERVGGREPVLFALLAELDRQGVRLATDAAERYIQLLCERGGDDETAVLDFVQRTADYRVGAALATVRPLAATHAATLGWLLERAGDLDGAYELCMRRLAESRGAPVQVAERRAGDVAALCARAAGVLAPAEAQRMWFGCIDAVLGRDDLAAQVRGVLHAASRSVDLAALVQRVMDATPAEGGAEKGGGGGGGGGRATSFGDIRHILSGMLVNAGFETRLLRGTARVLNDDLHARGVRAREGAERALRVTWLRCVVCRGRLAAEPAAVAVDDDAVAVAGEVLILGACAHAVHAVCWPTAGRTEDGGAVRCPRCAERVPDEVIGPRMLGADAGAVAVDAKEPMRARDGTPRLRVAAPPRIGIGGV